MPTKTQNTQPKREKKDLAALRTTVWMFDLL